MLVVLLEAEDTVSDLVLGSEVSGGEGFALRDREMNLDLVGSSSRGGQVH